MKSPRSVMFKIYTALGHDGRTAFISAVIFGLIAHMPALNFDVPNHDGLDSIYFDQNMLTSGRWFLGAACGVSSFYSLHWVIGVLSLIYLAVTAVFVAKLLKVKSPLFIVMIAGLLVTFPTLASNFAYSFTMDGYMMGLMFAVIAVYLVSVCKLGFVWGGVFLAFSMGIYQAYLPVAMLLSLYMALLILTEKTGIGEKISRVLKYLYMGVIGVGLYYVILKLLLAVTGKELDTYQGMNSAAESISLAETFKAVYKDFFSFTLKGHILFANPVALTAVAVLAVSFAVVLLIRAAKEKWFKSAWFYVILVATAVIVPLFANVMLIISKDITYHSLMRYQWVVFGIIATAFIENYLRGNESTRENFIEWVTTVSVLVCIICNILALNVGYSNLEKKYERTYAYCLRLADRIEQTEGYYEGIPIYMIGYVGDDNFPEVDITADVTDHMLNVGGNWLFYTPRNYELFYKHYMGISFNFLMPEEANYYDTEEYVAMPSFPGKGSTKVVDGVLYVKTENMH